MRIARDLALMSIAKVWQKRSTCLRLQVGAIIAIDGRPVVSGYNGAPAGMVHCYSAICGPDKPCTRTIHAEANCVAFAAKHGISIHGGTLYTTDSPCIECAKLLINGGILNVIYEREYRDRKPIDLLVEAGVTVTAYDSLRS